MRVLLDAGLMQHTRLNFHPNVNTATLTLDTADFRRFLAHTGHAVREVNLDGTGTP